MNLKKANLNRETFTYSEVTLTFFFFAYFLFLTFRSTNFVSTYIIIFIGFAVANVTTKLFLFLITKSKEIKFDERDKIIESKSYRNAYICVMILTNAIIILSITFYKILQPIVVFNLIISILFIAHIVLNLTKIFYYKRGI